MTINCCSVMKINDGCPQHGWKSYLTMTINKAVFQSVGSFSFVCTEQRYQFLLFRPFLNQISRGFAPLHQQLTTTCYATHQVTMWTEYVVLGTERQRIWKLCSHIHPFTPMHFCSLHYLSLPLKPRALKPKHLQPTRDCTVLQGARESFRPIKHNINA